MTFRSQKHSRMVRRAFPRCLLALIEACTSFFESKPRARFVVVRALGVFGTTLKSPVALEEYQRLSECYLARNHVSYAVVL